MSLTATAIGRELGMTPSQVNQRLHELGWIEPAESDSGWVVTAQGKKQGGEQRRAEKGARYVVWQDRILREEALRGGPDGSGDPGGRSSFLSSTNLGKRFDVSAQRMNLLLAELGWIEKGPAEKGWVPTSQGKRRGGLTKTAQSGVPYAVWPTGLADDRVLRSSIDEFTGGGSTGSERDSAEPTPARVTGGRPTHPAKHRASDGHMVRSRGEMLIDNWLYVAGIVHAYERRLPIEEEAYCDFWIPDGKVYMEYWGIEGDRKYDARKATKLEIYRQNELKLIEITNEDIKNLDDVLPRKLLKYNVKSK